MDTAVGPQLQTVTLDKPQGKLFCNLSYDNWEPTVAAVLDLDLDQP